MYLVLLLAVIVAIAAAGGKGYLLGKHECENDHAQAELKIAAKEAELRQAQAEKMQAAANTITDMEAAYEAGQSKAKVRYVEVQKQGGADVKSYPVFVNRGCDWPPDVVRNVQRAFAGLYGPANPGGSAGGVPAGASSAGQGRGPNDAGAALPVDPNPAGTVGNVHQTTGETGGSGQVPGNRVHPKPVPVGK